MSLNPGTSLGPYSVTAKIGEGGMGEVYRARDTTLDRDVALKVLPEAFASDPDRLARFQREAQVLASLNHPNIGHIYGLEEAEGQKALVLELIEGPTLEDRIKRGPIPLDEALPIAKQIAEALEAAHEAGVIHRDLKPANIKVRDDGTVKVLDFGLAKVLAGDAGNDPSESPTMTAATQNGVILGTAVYMSPEQASGSSVDKRTDIWAFGVVLFEMLTGRRAFDGESVSHVLAAVLKAAPDWTALPRETPAAIATLLRRCLAKERSTRAPHIGMARLEIVDALARPPIEVTAARATPQGGWQRAGSSAIVAMAVAARTALAVWNAMRPGEQQLVRFVVAQDEPLGLHISDLTSDVAVSRNGQSIAYLTGGNSNSGAQLHVRTLGELASEVLVEEGALTAPFFSPDGESVGFLDRATNPAKVKRVGIRDGVVSDICGLLRVSHDRGCLPLQTVRRSTVRGSIGDPQKQRWRVARRGHPLNLGRASGGFFVSLNI